MQHQHYLHGTTPCRCMCVARARELRHGALSCSWLPLCMAVHATATTHATRNECILASNVCIAHAMRMERCATVHATENNLHSATLCRCMFVACPRELRQGGAHALRFAHLPSCMAAHATTTRHATRNECILASHACVVHGMRGRVLV